MPRTKKKSMDMLMALADTTTKKFLVSKTAKASKDETFEAFFHRRHAPREIRALRSIVVPRELGTISLSEALNVSL